MLHLAFELIDQYDFSSLINDKFVNEGITCQRPHYIQCLIYIVVSFCYKYYYNCFIYIRGQLVCRKLFTHLRKNFFKSIQKSFNFLLQIITPFSSANIMGIDERFNIGGRVFV